METHILFFILAGVLIVILVGYSIWSARREKSRVFSNTFTTRPPSTPISHNEIVTDIPQTLNSQNYGMHSSMNNDLPMQDLAQEQQDVQENVSKIRISLQDQPRSEPFSANEQSTLNNNAPNIEPAVQVGSPIIEESTQQEISDTNIVTLYVVAPEGNYLYGETILQHLESLGFQYGEYQIFHRHLDNTASPVLFSVANIMQPGIFDLAKIEQFSTIGLVFFMYLPSVGNDLANLKLMIRTVESFAQSVGGIVLDEQHQIFNEESRQSYLLRVAN